MKKGFILSLLLAAALSLFAQQAAPQWNRVLSNTPESYRIQLVSSTEQSIQVNIQVPGFYTATVTTPRGEAKIITMPKAVSTAHAGEPDMPMTGIPVLIGDKARMSIRIVDAQYRDFEGVEVAPSKGDFPRTINPEDVPYTYGACYSEDAFFPASNIGLYEPYIIRDFRGQNMVVYPFAYNPATKTLRVYYNMTVEMYKVDDHGSNTIESRRSNVVKMDPDFKSVYQRHFINYEASMNRYTALDEEGDLLIICYDNFISSMTDFVNWKKTRGVNTTIVGTSTAGSTYSAIKTYIQNQYNANNNLTHVLLVGDVAQIPGYTYSGASGYEGKGDNPYGQVVGNDIYNDLFIGRFSASTAARVTTQCNRVITYERDLTTSASWLQVGQGIAKKEGGSGHNGEDDYQHMDVIRTDLMNYGYSPVYQRYANLSGYTATAAQISADINSGVGIINYCNHGAETMWGVASYSVSHVNALTNENKLPFIWSVACLVGKYDHSSDCFAEAWMNATNNSNPTGAIGTLMSYISQPWIPPMWAQDECVDILVESYSSNIKHTWGGVSVNGLMGFFDHYSTSTAQAVGTYQAWILYGDPSLMLRTKTPQAMTVTHTGSITLGATSYAVTVSNGNGAVATITDANHNILGKVTVSNGTANISINGTLTPDTDLTLCVFGYNKVTYLGTINVVGNANQAYITATANPAEGGTVSGGGTYELGDNCTLTATPNTGYTFTNWKKGNTVVSTNATYTFTVTENATYTATFTAIPQYTVTIAPNPVEGGTVAFGGRGNRDDIVYDFEDGWQGWTTFQGNTTSPNSWMHNTSYPTSNNNFSSGYGHNSSDGFMLSESYISGSSSGSGTAVTPDNYLVSPQVRLGGSISFYAGARNTSYCAEKFSVMVSTTDNTNASSFTTIATWTLSLSEAGYNSTPYTVDLSAYSGMGYVAIRHYDCYDQWFLCVDDITIVEGEIETGEMSATFYEGETCTVTATPNEGYSFVNWTENGTAVSTDASYSFTVTADRSLVADFAEVAIQTVSLTKGSNWWTPTVNVTLAQLEAALGTSGLLINSQDGGFAEYANGSWSGTLTSIEPGKMYKIETNDAVSLTVSGTPTTSVSLTIMPGYNWFGYTGTQAKTIAAALGDFSPSNGDTITAQDGTTATYNNGSWNGTLNTLQPGLGYIYNSTAFNSKQMNPGNNE
ncbi:MAG: choice-of-anchor J domain-containing protein [Bacteroidales bacterium]|nr:choice-of-anchor J domain-containing protein [Bacteroidales bacterium]